MIRKASIRCNLRCNGYPYHRRAREPGAHMSWERAVEALSELKRLGCRFVIFEWGGTAAGIAASPRCAVRRLADISPEMSDFGLVWAASAIQALLLTFPDGIIILFLQSLWWWNW